MTAPLLLTGAAPDIASCLHPFWCIITFLMGGPGLQVAGETHCQLSMGLFFSALWLWEEDKLYHKMVKTRKVLLCAAEFVQSMICYLVPPSPSHMCTQRSMEICKGFDLLEFVVGLRRSSK